ncbi:MAG TPA: hypothetical protein DF712_11140, partial [Balneola sp.]|nr:hypothetical protein [Balneola sp.]
AINAEKNIFKSELQKGNITKDEYLDAIEELNNVEGALSTTEAADQLTVEEAQNLIRDYRDLQVAQQELSDAKQEVENQTLPEGEIITDAEIAVIENEKKVK